MREVAEARVSKHKPVLVKAGREHGNSALKIEIHGDPGRARVPEIAVGVLEGVAVTGAGQKTSWLVGYRVVRGVSERSERTITHVGAVCVNVVLGPGCGVLKVV